MSQTSVAKKKVDSTVAAAYAHFKKIDPILYHAALPHKKELEARVTHRRSYKERFAALAGSIVSQQLSTKAADTIWERLKIACKGEVTPEAIIRLREPTLRKAGLSAAKVKSLKELSRALNAKTLDLVALSKVPEAEAIEKLTSVWGIGTWTAEMFLMFALERSDVFSLKDLGLRRSIEALYNLPKDAPLALLEAISLRWAPHRTTASRILWRVRDSG